MVTSGDKHANVNEPLIECMNTNMVDIVTPVRADVLRNLLVESDPDTIVTKLNFCTKVFQRVSV